MARLLLAVRRSPLRLATAMAISRCRGGAPKAQYDGSCLRGGRGGGENYTRLPGVVWARLVSGARFLAGCAAYRSWSWQQARQRQLASYSGGRLGEALSGCNWLCGSQWRAGRQRGSSS